LDLGAAWTVLGTKACLDPGFLREMIREFKDRIIVGIDAKDGHVATDGWTRITQIRALELVGDAEAIGARTVIYTDIARDGALQGPNLSAINEIASATRMQLIASGGFSALADLAALSRLDRPNIIGVVIGKALYENKFTFKEAAEACSPSA
jgi:phosphoribosylformimino-5-aminoimidazole carboxamide ribotide isomerase